MTAAVAGGLRAGGVRAAARITAVADGRGGTALPVLAGDGPFALRRTRATGRGAQVTVIGAMSAPLGGDRLELSAEVGAGAELTVTSAAATISLPGTSGEPATYDVRLDVGEDAVLRWLPEQVIAAAGSDLRMTTRVELAADARLVYRDEQVLGRAGERPGRLTTRLTVHRAGEPLLDQELSFGPGIPGWDGPAVLYRYRAVGQLLVVSPDFGDEPPTAAILAADPDSGQAVSTPLAGPAVLVTAVAPDALCLRRLLDTAIRTVMPNGDGSGAHHPKTAAAGRVSVAG
ncbi:urease accessory protein UreD [Streptomyces sp. So13.3]|uniref:urease accessory protein UreD n=1 Tax=Streptomyces TaxID=1883 RepID=UPI001106F61F|nr:MULTISPECIES: urease accessory protein UreD [Streptomyces]MCZ4099269.1 urease accessory protein UreD [Streptomyces sp. H39-C1]QNA71548.1 urease accessory protein UreD [Streptomyces sp. So13.3]